MNFYLIQNVFELKVMVAKFEPPAMDVVVYNFRIDNICYKLLMLNLNISCWVIVMLTK